jgi:hypothetical protein
MHICFPIPHNLNTDIITWIIKPELHKKSSIFWMREEKIKVKSILLHLKYTCNIAELLVVDLENIFACAKLCIYHMEECSK